MAGAALACVAIIVAACGQGASGTPASQATPQATSVAPTPNAPTAAVTPPVATLPPPPALELLWEATGDGTSGEHPATYSPAVDPLTGDIWVAVPFDGIIWIFSEDGSFNGSFGKPGKGDGEFDFLRPTCSPCGAGAMAFAPDGTLFVADVGNARVQKFDAKHKFVKAWGSFGSGVAQFADPHQIATNGHEVFVSDDARLDTQVFDMNGTHLRTIANGGWLAVDPAGDLFISHQGTVTKYHPDGTSVSSFALPNDLSGEHIGLALDGHGRLFFDYQRDADPFPALGLSAVDLTGKTLGLWTDAGETLAIEGNVLYEANFTTSGWPKALLRAYELPAP